MSREVRDRKNKKNNALFHWSARFYNCLQLFTSRVSLVYTTQLSSTSFFCIFSSFYFSKNIFPNHKSQRTSKYTYYKSTQLTKYITEVKHVENLRYFWSEVVCGSWTISLTFFFVLSQLILLFRVALVRLGSLVNVWWRAFASEDELYWEDTENITTFHPNSSSTVEIHSWIMAYGNVIY